MAPAICSRARELLTRSNMKPLCPCSASGHDASCTLVHLGPIVAQGDGSILRRGTWKGRPVLLSVATGGQSLADCPSSLVGVEVPHHAALLHVSPARVIHAAAKGRPLDECDAVASPYALARICRQALEAVSQMAERGFVYRRLMAGRILVDAEGDVTVVGHTFASTSDGSAEHEAVRAVAWAMLDAWSPIAPLVAEPRASEFAAALVGHLEAGARGDYESASTMVTALSSISTDRRRQSAALAAA